MHREASNDKWHWWTNDEWIFRFYFQLWQTDWIMIFVLQLLIIHYRWFLTRMKQFRIHSTVLIGILDADASWGILQLTSGRLFSSLFIHGTHAIVCKESHFLVWHLLLSQKTHEMEFCRLVHRGWKCANAYPVRNLYQLGIMFESTDLLFFVRSSVRDRIASLYNVPMRTERSDHKQSMLNQVYATNNTVPPRSISVD